MVCAREISELSVHASELSDSSILFDRIILLVYISNISHFAFTVC